MIMMQQENSLSSKDFSEKKPIKAKKKKKNEKPKEYVHKKSKRVINSHKKYRNVSMINDKYEYGLSDW